MKLGMQVGLRNDHIVLDGDPAHNHQFSVHVCCGQMAGRIKISLVMAVDLGPRDIE